MTHDDNEMQIMICYIEYNHLFYVYNIYSAIHTQLNCLNVYCRLTVNI